MKAFVHVLLVAACLVACARALPGGRRDSFEDDDFEDMSLNFAMQNFLADTLNRIRSNLFNYFWNMPDLTNIKIPEGANTTSTVKIIDGHVVTINETTYEADDENGGTAFRIRIIDVKPQNETLPPIGSDAGPTTPRAVAPVNTESAETVEDFNNEISKNGGDTLNA